MAFSTKELEIIKYGMKNGKTRQEIEGALAKSRLGVVPDKVTTEAPADNVVTETVNDIKQTGGGIAEAAKRRASNVGESVEAFKQGKQGILRTAGQLAGQAAGLGSDIIAETTKGAIKAVLPQKAETALKDTAQSVVEPIVASDAVQSVMAKYNALDEKTKRDIDALIGVGSLALDVATFGGAKKAAEVGTKSALKAGEQALGAVKPVLSQGIDTTTDVLKGAKNLVGSVTDDLARIPGRVATNVAEKQAVAQTIKKLPTAIAREAAQNGVAVQDLSFLYKIPKVQKAPLRKLLDVTQKFEKGLTKTNPIEVVGKPIVNRIKTLSTEASKVGAKLGTVSEKLGKVTTQELFPTVYDSLKKIPGLSGLKVSKKGILDFTDTVLATAETSADRKAIQNIFRDAIRAGTGKQKHLLRQELFEVLGGKKTAQLAITGTQEKAYEAIRSGLSTVLEGKNTTYKALSNEYRKMIQPLKDMRKFMKNVAGADEDILDMSAGLLARRLTSNAASNPQIRSILRALDNASKVKGKTLLNVESLQDFYNILDKYYDIANKTGFQSQVASGVEKARDIGDFAVQKLREVAGTTDAVKRKAIEKALMEALK